MNSAVVEGIRSIASPLFQERELVATVALVGTSPALPAVVDSPLVRTLVATAEVVSAELDSCAASAQPERRDGRVGQEWCAW